MNGLFRRSSFRNESKTFQSEGYEYPREGSLLNQKEEDSAMFRADPFQGANRFLNFPGIHLF